MGPSQTVVNSKDPKCDKMSRNAAFFQGLHCLREITAKCKNHERLHQKVYFSIKIKTNIVVNEAEWRSGSVLGP